MVTDLKDFNYEPPQMYYDKKSGEIKIKERVGDAKKKFINNINDLEKEKRALFKEVGLTEQGEGLEGDSE